MGGRFSQHPTPPQKRDKCPFPTNHSAHCGCHHNWHFSIAKSKHGRACHMWAYGCLKPLLVAQWSSRFGIANARIGTTWLERTKTEWGLCAVAGPWFWELSRDTPQSPLCCSSRRSCCPVFLKGPRRMLAKCPSCCFGGSFWLFKIVFIKNKKILKAVLSEFSCSTEDQHLRVHRFANFWGGEFSTYIPKNFSSKHCKYIFPTQYTSSVKMRRNVSMW